MLRKRKCGVANGSKASYVPRMNFVPQFRSFTPKDLTSITGLSPTMQRDWRRNGYLPPRESGWSSFDLEEVSKVALLKVLADAGLGPGFGNDVISGDVGRAIVRSIGWWVVEAEEAEAWVGDLTPSTASEVLALDADDHFALVSRVTGLDVAERLQAVQIDPIKRTIFAGIGAGADEAPIGLISLTVRLDALGQQIAQRVGKGVLKLQPSATDC